MDDNFKKQIELIRDLESLKVFCNSHLLEIAVGNIDNLRYKPTIRIRFIDPDAKFGFAILGGFFFIDDCMYLITDDKKYEEYHNPIIADAYEELDILNYS